MINESDLAHYTGTMGYHRFGFLSKLARMVMSDGAKYIADNGGGHGAYWLMDAIASHQPKARKIQALREIQFWTLTVKNGKGVLTCQIDSGIKPTITQRIEYTDFDLPEIKLWVEPMGDGNYCILLPQEH